MSVSVPANPAPTAAASSLLNTPDITAAQIVAGLTGAVGLAVALGVPLSHDKQLAIEAFVVTFAPVLVVVDAWIRHSRAKYVQTALLGLANAAAAAAPLLSSALTQANGGAEPTIAGTTPLPPYIK
ncbi:MAG TPA: hypothetical protein VFB25_08055 [Gaiellaceae bacterium]|nr:hypothetical protein [Gaiellaceae bacterium]